MRLLKALVDLSGLKIINSRATNLTNINIVVMAALIDERKTMTMCNRKAQENYDSYMKTVSLKVTMEGGHH